MRPGCGTKLVILTDRGTEIAEMLTTTCDNGGCGKNISRKEILSYIDASGGTAYPFTTNGRVERVATVDDMTRWSSTQARAGSLLHESRTAAAGTGLPFKLIEVELLFGGERAIVHYTVDMSQVQPPNPTQTNGKDTSPPPPIDPTPLQRAMVALLGMQVDLQSAGPRDEARLTADYEKCGQYCCCKNFLKVLKPVSMKLARHQKATMDPLKISGRCGRLMCCLRYEENSYADLIARLPKRGSRVGTPEGSGVVIDSKVMVQLVLVRLDQSEKEIAIAVEDLTAPSGG